jgi:NAD(P)-dependent dehydrogenase (short-subunit alcohol dehydrogenase family)
LIFRQATAMLPSMSIAVVTGAGRGLGRLISERLAARGLTVLATDINAEAVEETAGLCGNGAWSMRQDVRDPASHREVAAVARERGPVRVWVNNAGVMPMDTAWDHRDDEVRMTVEVNFLGVIWGSRAAVDVMKPTGGGNIINIASMSSLCPVPGLAVYAATKAAVLGFTTSLQGDLDNAQLPVRVSAICPDAIETDLVRNVWHKEHAGLLFSAGKLLKPEAVAAVAVGLLDDYRLVVEVPRARAALAYALAPFPAFGLRILREFAKRGERVRRARGHHA